MKLEEKSKLPELHSGETSAGKLVKIFDKISIKIAILLIVLMTVSYFVLAELNPDNKLVSKMDVLSKYFFGFAQESIIAILPVFILFVLSYWLLREINDFRHKEEIKALTRTIADSVVEVLGAKTSADKFFARRTEESVLAENAERELLLVQETGSLLFEQSKTKLNRLLKNGGVIKLVVVDPSPQSANILAYRSADMHRDGIANRAAQLIAHLESLSPNSELKLEVRFSPYPVCSTMVIADKDHEQHSKAQALVRLAGFRVPFEEKLDFQMSLNTSPATFSHYVKEFQSLWKASSKILLITGEPESGKTTLLTKLKEQLADLCSVYFCISKAILDSEGKRKGFEIITSVNPMPRQFAAINEDGKYQPDLTIIDAVATEIQNALQKCRLLIIDEIGPIQLQSNLFATVIKSALDRPNISIIASIAKDDSTHALLKKIKSHFRPCLVQLEKQRNDQSILEQIQSEAETLLQKPPFLDDHETGNKKTRRS